MIIAGFEAAFQSMLGTGSSPIAQTPSEVAYTENKLRLLHYLPVVERPGPVPLLIIPAALSLFDPGPRARH